jgi:GntR family phosphonate transport system transcriptional regulator
LTEQISSAFCELTVTQFAPRSTQPIWLQIYDRIEAACLDGKLVAGCRLPGENQMSDLFGVSRVTLRRALSRLQQEGLLQARKGVGIYVRQVPLRYTVDHGSRFSDGLVKNDLVVTARTLSLLRRVASVEEAAALNVALGNAVIELRRLRLVDEAVIYRSVKVFPLGRFPDFEEVYAKDGSVRDVYEAHGVARYRRAETRVSGGFATRSEAEDLQLTRDTPVLRTVAVNLCPAGRPIEFNTGTWLLTAVELVLKDPVRPKTEPTERGQA